MNDNSYVSLSLEKYNELYEKAKKFDELTEECKGKVSERFDAILKNIFEKDIEQEEKNQEFYIGQRVEIKSLGQYSKGTIKELRKHEAFIEFDNKCLMDTWYGFNELENIESEEEK